MIEGRAPPPPIAVLLGWKCLAVDCEAGMVRGTMVARDEFLNPSGTVQGGILTSMLDNVLGLAIIATLGAGQLAPTLELKANFIRPGKLGSYIGEGRIVSRGTGVCFLDAKLNDANGNLIATATSTARILSPR